MPTEAEIRNVLSRVIDPELRRNIVELGMVRDIQVHGDEVEIEVALTTAACPLSQNISDDVQAAVKALPGVREVKVTLSEMTAEEREATLEKAQPGLPKASQFNKVGRIVAVMSGKGGVGKSSVTALLALALARRGYKVGILDADITGPSIPKLFGLHPGEVRGDPMGFLPAIAAENIKVMSINLLVPDETTAVIWRGPLISNAIQQFWNEVLWGHLDYLLVDLPPGTSDAALTVMQSLPVNGALVVTTPQDLAAMVVRKAVDMAHQLNVPIVGVVENMSYFQCPDSGKRYEIFGPSHADEVATAANATTLARLPVDPELSRLGDQGQIAKYNGALIDELGKAFESECPLPRRDL
ncbi:MAG: Mrp/NBP35 family ATP-binding protein [Chloroflexi bacterium]|nr:Mrp/NBP35 family ATP-binding protein [Chloroflexota bacterium]